jgi:hypothetical protein
MALVVIRTLSSRILRPILDLYPTVIVVFYRALFLEVRNALWLYSIPPNVPNGRVSQSTPGLL